MSNKILEKLPRVQKNVFLKDYTSYKIGGPAKYFFIAKTKEDLIEAIKIAKDLKIKLFILGGGSNLLVSDKGFNGLVIKINICGIKLEGSEATIGAGESLTKSANFFTKNKLSGLEWSAGIPGTIGGAIYGHAQAFGTKISSSIKSVEAVDSKNLKIKEFTREQCKFSLKNSIFKKNKNLVIISTVLKFKKSSSKEIEDKVKEFLNYRKTRHPMNFPSAGSTFVNPEIKIKNKKLLESFPELVEFNSKGMIPAGYLIQKCGIQGKKIGNAQISEKHSNFIINLGGAKAKGVLALMNLARKKVKEQFGINLETEIQLL
jgi:UDP-N-acetylmuramate dehydrogenase